MKFQFMRIIGQKTSLKKILYKSNQTLQCRSIKISRNLLNKTNEIYNCRTYININNHKLWLFLN